MRGLWLTDEQARTLARHAQAESPREACGIIGGQAGRATRIVPTRNAAADPQHFYRIDDAELARTLMRMRRDGLELIGFYHSHPRGEPLPSAVDIAEAMYPDAAYVIIGLKRGGAEVGAWRIRHGNAERLDLHVGETAPLETDEPLSRAQKVAIIISAALALAAMLALSLSLLPPAPEIPLP